MQNNIATFIHRYSGWYPRWWLIAALLCSMTMLAGAGLNIALCTNTSPTDRALICSVAGDSPYLVQILLIWFLFIIFWFISLAFGLKPIEAPPAMRQRSGKILRTLTTFGPLHTTLVVQGIIAVIIIHIMWWFDNAPSTPFALLWICAFLAHTSIFYRNSAERRRLYLSAYGFIALVMLIIELLFKQNFFSNLQQEWVLLTMQVLFIIIGLIAIFWRSPQPVTQLIPDLNYDHLIYEALTPLTIIGSLWPFNRFLPPPHDTHT